MASIFNFTYFWKNCRTDIFFFIAEGAYYTHSRKKYLSRLLIFALISHFAYCFAFGINFIPFSTGTFFNQTSIMWSLALGLIGIIVQDSNIKKYMENNNNFIIMCFRISIRLEFCCSNDCYL